MNIILLAMVLTTSPNHDFLNQNQQTRQQVTTFSQGNTQTSINQSLQGQQIYANWLNRPQYNPNSGGGNYYNSGGPVRRFFSRFRRR